MDRNKVSPTNDRFFELFSERDLALGFVEEFDTWTKITFARELSQPWRRLLEDRLSKFPTDVTIHWTYHAAQVSTLSERVEEVRSNLKSSCLQPHEPKFRARLLDLGVQERAITLLQNSWPNMSNRPSLAHRETFNNP